MALRFLLLSKFCSDSGYSEKAVRRKIEAGVFREGLKYRRAPDGRIHIDISGYEKWLTFQKG